MGSSRRTDDRCATAMNIAIDATLFCGVVFPIGLIVVLHSVYLSGMGGVRMTTEADALYVAEAYRMAKNAIILSGAAGAVAASSLWCVFLRIRHRAFNRGSLSRKRRQRICVSRRVL
jgi:hypothetical protein